MLSAELITAHELCPRRALWTQKYRTRISLIAALYRALDAGLRTDKDPEKTAENEYMTIASNPGLDMVGGDVFACAMHYSKLAGILALALRSAWKAPWKPVGDVALEDGTTWQSACYEEPDGKMRRIVLVDRWSDDRKAQEISGWRSVGEVCALNRPMILTAITIGASHEKRRHSPWTRCYRHPRNRTIRMKRKTSTEDFGSTWKPVLREDAGLSTEAWLTQMRADGCIEDLVHSTLLPASQTLTLYLQEMTRIVQEIDSLPEVPPMHLAGCYGFSPCPFLGVCPGNQPEAKGFRLVSAELHQSPQPK